jgi:SAM-dependent methyltransferase
MHALEQNYWWFQGRRLTIFGVLEQALASEGMLNKGGEPLRLLDAGCGTGMLPDDVRVMSEFFRVLRPGGLAVMTVPAHPSLWSSHDVALHHYRRYTRAGFEGLVKNAGFEVVRFTPTVATAYMPAAVFRRVKRWIGSDAAEPRTDEFPLPRWMNATLLGMMRAEARWLRHHDLPFGLSLLCIARKPSTRP